ILRKQGKTREAVELSRRAFEIHRAQLGEDHPRSAYQRINLGVALIDLGELEEGQRHGERALEILQAVASVDRRSIAHAWATLAIALYSQGEHAQAEQQLRQALALDQLPAATLQINLAMILKAQGRLDEAIEVYRDALESLEHDESTPERELMTARALGELGTLLNKPAKDEPAKDEAAKDEAAEYFERAIAILERTERVQDPMVISVFNRYGDLLRERGDDTGAERSYRRALAAYQSFDGATYGVKIAITLERLADLERGRGRWSSALELLERAQTTLLAAGTESKPERLENLEQRLAEVRAKLDAP
ncbi:MAG: tetratricopeptide repeat protein, partial [Myxococcales bacterium]|nr:tetratricopeptide repeat protein [Myxococcales bacterium]